jgi:aminoglycoside phosphotransferase (APT) family kinase protein
MNAQTAEELCRRLEKFLSQRLTDASVSVRDYRPIAGGYSRVMGCFDLDLDGETTTLVARADPPAGKDLVRFDTGTEWALLEALTEQGRTFLPAARWFDPSGDELGAPTMIIDFVPGAGISAGLTCGSETRRDRIATQVASLAADIHAVRVDSIPSAMAHPAGWDDYIRAAIATWRTAEAGHVEANPFLRYVATWLDSNKPEPAPLTLVHGDLQPPNIMTGAHDDLVAVDWEFAHIGDPREDLGWLMMIESLGAPSTYGRDPEAFCRAYRERSGLGADVINPRAVAFFSILAVGRIFSPLYAQVSALAQGTNRNLGVAYSAATALTVSHERWYRLIHELDAEPSTTRSLR